MLRVRGKASSSVAAFVWLPTNPHSGTSEASKISAGTMDYVETQLLRT